MSSTDSMWTEASRDTQAERSNTEQAKALVALADLRGFLCQASSEAEYEDRLALVRSDVDQIVTATVLLPADQRAVYDTLRSDALTVIASRPGSTNKGRSALLGATVTFDGGRTGTIMDLAPIENPERPRTYNDAWWNNSITDYGQRATQEGIPAKEIEACWVASGPEVYWASVHVPTMKVLDSHLTSQQVAASLRKNAEVALRPIGNLKPGDRVKMGNDHNYQSPWEIVESVTPVDGGFVVKTDKRTHPAQSPEARYRVDLGRDPFFASRKTATLRAEETAERDYAVGDYVVEKDPSWTYPLGTRFYVEEIFEIGGEEKVGVRPDSRFSSQWEVFLPGELTKSASRREASSSGDIEINRGGVGYFASELEPGEKILSGQEFSVNGLPKTLNYDMTIQSVDWDDSEVRIRTVDGQTLHTRPTRVVKTAAGRAVVCGACGHEWITKAQYRLACPQCGAEESVRAASRKTAKDAYGYDWEHGDWAMFTNWNGAQGVVRVVNNKSTAWEGGPRDSHVDVAFNEAAWDLGVGMSTPQGTPVERHKLAPLPSGMTPSYREASATRKTAVTLDEITHDGPVRVRERGQGGEGIDWTVQPENFPRTIEMINQHGGPDFWEVTPVEATKAATREKTAAGVIRWEGDTHFGVGFLMGKAPNGDIYEVYHNPNANPFPCSWANYGPNGDTGLNSAIALGRGLRTMREAVEAAEAHAASKVTASRKGAAVNREGYGSRESAKAAAEALAQNKGLSTSGWDGDTLQTEGAHISLSHRPNGRWHVEFWRTAAMAEATVAADSASGKAIDSYTR